MWEFPLHIMDGNLIQHGKPYGNKTLREAQDITKTIIDRVISDHGDYLTVLFHDLYFDKSFSIWRDWYLWLVEFLKSSGFEFVGYPQAVTELESCL
jgi:hypothetical protein